MAKPTQEKKNYGVPPVQTTALIIIAITTIAIFVLLLENLPVSKLTPRESISGAVAAAIPVVPEAQQQFNYFRRINWVCGDGLIGGSSFSEQSGGCVIEERLLAWAEKFCNPAKLMDYTLLDSCQPMPACVDSDGRDYFTKGTMYYANTPSILNVDVCTNSQGGNPGATGSFVNEYVCPANPKESDIDLHQCDFGCKNGACFKLPQYSCKDSDKGKEDYYTLGQVTGDNGEGKLWPFLNDVCVDTFVAGDPTLWKGDQGRYVSEQYCDKDPDHGVMHYENVFKCPKGCVAGVCVSKPVLTNLKLKDKLSAKEPEFEFDNKGPYWVVDSKNAKQRYSVIASLFGIDGSVIITASQINTFPEVQPKKFVWYDLGRKEKFNVKLFDPINNKYNVVQELVRTEMMTPGRYTLTMTIVMPNKAEVPASIRLKVV